MTKKKFRWPPGIAIWIIAFLVVPTVLKKSLGWPEPPSPGDTFGARFVAHFRAELILGLLVLVPFLFTLWWSNRNRTDDVEQ